MMTIEGLLPQWQRLPVKEVVLETEDFIVFINHGDHVEWVTSDAWDAQNPSTSKHKRALQNVALVETLSYSFLSKDQRHHFLRLVGEAYARCLELDYAASGRCADDAREYLAKRLKSASRTWYVSACCGAAAAIFAVWLAINVTFLGGWASVATLTARYDFAFIAGVVGAGISVMQRLYKTRVEWGAERFLYLMDGLIRVVSGGLAGMVSLMAMRAGLLAPALVASQGSPDAVLLIALAAGSSERWLSSVLTHLNGVSGHMSTKGENQTPHKEALE